MPRPSSGPSREILEAALQGLESQRERLDHQISEVRGLLGQRSSQLAARKGVKSAGSTPSAAQGKRPKRVLSPEARKRIAAAQKKRWAAFRKAQG